MQTVPENKLSHRERLVDEMLATLCSRDLEGANLQAVRTRAAEGLREISSKDNSAHLVAVAAELAAKRDEAKAAYEAAELAAGKAADIARLSHEAALKKVVTLRKIPVASREYLLAEGLTTVRALEKRFGLSSSGS